MTGPLKQKLRVGEHTEIKWRRTSKNPESGTYYTRIEIWPRPYNGNRTQLYWSARTIEELERYLWRAKWDLHHEAARRRIMQCERCYSVVKRWYDESTTGYKSPERRFCQSCFVIYQEEVETKRIELEEQRRLRRIAANKEKHRRYGSTHHGRARYYGVPYEPVPPIFIFERDGWVCHICGNITDRNAPPRSANSPSLDHIVPMSKGGPHLRSNLATACFLCNCRKGNKTEVTS